MVRPCGDRSLEEAFVTGGSFCSLYLPPPVLSWVGAHLGSCPRALGNGRMHLNTPLSPLKSEFRIKLLEGAELNISGCCLLGITGA